MQAVIPTDRVLGAGTDAWLLIPLPHAGTIIGFIALAPPRTRNAITPEDRDLIELVARQCAHYIVEQDALRQLEETRQFERFNRQYAFVVHDMKNLVSQLSVMTHNAERHWDDPGFRDDFRESVRDTLERMNHLIERVSAMRQGAADGGDPAAATRLDALISERIRDLDARHAARVTYAVTPAGRDTAVALRGEQIGSVLDHLVANGSEATGRDGHVNVSLDADDTWAVVDVTDDGPGMNPTYAAEHLFRPFRSTKRHGMGLGTYQCRETLREHGGDLEVVTSQGSGTTMRIRLPAHTAAAQARPHESAAG